MPAPEASTPSPFTPVTAPSGEATVPTLTRPAPVVLAWMPSPALPVTRPEVVMVVVPAPVSAVLMPTVAPDTVEPAATITAPP